MMQVLILASYDSFLHVGGLIAPYFEEKGCKITYALVRARVRKQISSEQIEKIGLKASLRWVEIEELCNSGQAERFDIIISCLEGLSTRRLMHNLSYLEERRPLVICVYPGLVIRYPYDGFAARSSADLLWLNCQYDLDSYASMCTAFGQCADNARLFGIASLLQPIRRNENVKQKSAVFFEQAIIPRYEQERSFLAHQLIRLANRFPAWEILVKPRTTGSEATLHRVRHAIVPLLKEAAIKQGGWPKNLQITAENASSLLGHASQCLTITSTVAVEALHANIPTAVISDFGAHDDYGMNYFFRSGLMRRFSELILPTEDNPRQEWVSSHIADPKLTIIPLVEEAIFLAKIPRRPIVYCHNQIDMSEDLRNWLFKAVGEKSVMARDYQRSSSYSKMLPHAIARVMKGVQAWASKR